MREIVRLFSVIVLLGCAGTVWAQSNGVKAIDVIVKKHPTGGAAAMNLRTDAAGNVSAKIESAGTYEVRIFCPRPCPLKPGRYSASVKKWWSVVASKGAISTTGGNRSKRPAKHFVVPDIPAAAFPAEGLTLYTEDIVISRAPAVIYMTVRSEEPLLSTTALTFIAEEGGVAPQPQSFAINAGGAPAFKYEIQTIYKEKRDDSGTPPTWLALSQTSGSYPLPDRQPEIQATVSTRGLPPGLHQAEVRVCTTRTDEPTTCASLVATILVKERGTGPGLTISRAGLLFTSLVGANPDVESARLCNQSSASTDWRSVVPAAQARLIALAPAQGTLASGACIDIRVTATTGGLAAGVLQFAIVIERPPNLPGPTHPPIRQDISIFVAAPNCVANTVYPVLLHRPAELVTGVGNNFRTVPVDNCGGIAAHGVVSGDIGGGTVYARSSLKPAAEDSRPGAAQKAITKGGANGFYPVMPDDFDDDSVEVIFTGENPAQPAAAARRATFSGTKSGIKSQAMPRLTIDPVGSLANPDGPNVPPPGSAASFAKAASRGLTPIRMALPDAIEGESLILNGKKVPLLHSVPLEVAAIIPGDTPPGRHTVLLETADGLSLPREFDVEVAQPALYTWDGSGQGPAMIYNSTRGGMVGDANPARAGDILVAYVCGLGAVDPAIPLGQVAPQDPISRAVHPVEVIIDGKPAEVLFAGPVPGYAGFGQINFKVPEGLTGPAAIEEEEIVVKVAEIANQQSATTWFAKTRTRTAQVTVTSNPAGLAVFVDGVRTATPRTFDWVVDSVHTVSVASPQNETATGRLIFANWNGDTYTQSLTVTANANYSVAANFIQQYKLTTAVTVPNATPIRPSITITPLATDGFYNAGTQVRLAPGTTGGLRFNNWTGDASGSANPLNVTLSAPRSVTAVYVVAPINPAPGPAQGLGK
jgi:uncharacterized protein (TIGR03437 family)